MRRAAYDEFDRAIADARGLREPLLPWSGIDLALSDFLLMSSPPEHSATLHVAIVSNNPETLGDLAGYLQRAGATTTGTHRIEGSMSVGAGAAAVVIFPDDFAWDAVVRALTACSRTYPRALLVLVTNAPQRFEALAWPKGAVTPLAVPKPAWGWSILDAIRAHQHGPVEPTNHP